MILVHFVGMECNTGHKLDGKAHVFGFGGEDTGVLELDVMFIVKTIFCHCQYVWLSLTDKLVFLFHCNVGNLSAHCRPDHTWRKCCTCPVFTPRSSFREWRNVLPAS
jgi:hypothetical protein